MHHSCQLWNPEPQPGKDGGRKASPSQGSDPFLYEEMAGVRRDGADLRRKGCIGRTSPLFLWAGELLLYPLEVLGKRPTHLPLIIPALVRKSSCKPLSGFGNVTVQGDGGRNHRARGSTVSAADLSAQEGRFQKGRLGNQVHKALALLFQDRGQWQAIEGSACASSEPGAKSWGFLSPPRPRVG